MIYMMYDQTSSTIFWLIFLLILDPGGGSVCVNVDGRREGLFKPPGLIEKLQAVAGRVKRSCVCVRVYVCI